MPKLDLLTAPHGSGTRYPAPFDQPCRERRWHRLGEAAGLTQFGVNLLHLAAGAWSSQRHWHTHEDEFVYVLRGEVVLVSDEGELTLRAGDCAGFKAGVGDGHCFQNRGVNQVDLLVVGSRSDEDQCEYPDIDMRLGAGRYSGKADFRRKDGSRY